jgi:GNAT superfamily N-acetyltransferase
MGERVFVEIKYDKSAASTDAFAILAEAWNEVVQEGVTPEGLGTPPFDQSSEVLYAVSRDGDVVGVLAFTREADRAVVQLAYVEPSSRRLGVLRELLDALKQRACQAGLAKLALSLPSASPAENVFVRLGFGRGRVILFEQQLT